MTIVIDAGEIPAHHFLMGRMSHLYFVSVMTTALCSGCPNQGRADRRTEGFEPQSYVAQPGAATTSEAAPSAEEVMILPVEEPVDDGAMRMCVLPAALDVDPTLPVLAEAVADYWGEEGFPMRVVEPGDGCVVVLDVNDVAIAKDGWGFKEAQTWIPNTITETNPVLVRFRQGFWIDPVSSQELKAALFAHEVGHIFLGAEHEPEATGKLMSPIVTEDVAQALFGGKL